MAVAETLKLGGDAKSNVAIVGGMLGALIGVKRIPKSMVMNLLNVGLQGQHARQEFLNIRKHLIKNLDLLIESMPSSQLVIMEESKADTERD